MPRLRSVAALLALLTASGCTKLRDGFVCAASSDCVLNGTRGNCELTSYCSFPSTDCPTGRRYSAFAAKPLASECVTSPTPGGDGGLGCIEQLAAGGKHACARTTSGSVYCWGYAGFGQLGGGNTTSSSTPVQVVSTAPGQKLTGAALITAGEFHSCARLQNSNVFCWGSNAAGQLGDAADVSVTPTPTGVPKQVAGLSTVTHIAAGAAHTCARLADGTAACWGRNAEGQLGNRLVGCPYNPNSGNISSPVGVAANCDSPALTGLDGIFAGGNTSCAVQNSGVALCWGSRGSNFAYVPTQIAGNAKSAATGPTAVCVLDADKHVQCAGDNTHGVLGIGTSGAQPGLVPVLTTLGGAPLDAVRQISMGTGHACAVLEDDTMRCWGLNFSGQLGDNSTTDRFSPTSPLRDGQPLDHVAEVAAGGDFTCARLIGGSVLCWGRAAEGQLGDGSPLDPPPSPQPVPTAVQLTCDG